MDWTTNSTVSEDTCFVYEYYLDVARIYPEPPELPTFPIGYNLNNF